MSLRNGVPLCLRGEIGLDIESIGDGGCYRDYRDLKCQLTYSNAYQTFWAWEGALSCYRIWSSEPYIHDEGLKILPVSERG